MEQEEWKPTSKFVQSLMGLKEEIRDLKDLIEKKYGTSAKPEDVLKKILEACKEGEK
jgi:hypothetical protein